jgi:hypothetical protein
VAGISKAWRDAYLKDVYNTVLNTEEGTEAEIKTIMDIRKAMPLSKVAKFFIKTLMEAEAKRAIQTHQVDLGGRKPADAVKALTKTKKFKAYIADLALNAPKTKNYWNYLANIIRALVFNETHLDIAETVSWRRRQIPVNAEYQPPEVLRPAGAMPAITHTVQVQNIPSPEEAQALREFVALLELQAQSDVDPDVLANARQLGMSLADGLTNGQILRAVQGVLQQAGG